MRRSNSPQKQKYEYNNYRAYTVELCVNVYWTCHILNCHIDKYFEFLID